MPVNPARADTASPLAAVARLLACPECGADLAVSDRSLSCTRGHAFDLARQGYVSLLTGASTKMSGDTSDMLDARAAFQRARHFAPIADAVTTALSSAAPPRAILEIGAGTGYYLASALDAAPDARGIALDVSKPAARRCARAHPRAAAVVADAWRGLPVRDGALSHVLCVFAPRNADEVARILSPDGAFVVAAPTSAHLSELITPLDMVRVDSAKDDRLADALSGRFERLTRDIVEYPMTLDHADITNVAAMGPSAFHATTDRAARIATLPESVEVTASVTVSTYRLR
ncbi:23S rRNA (guanine745-N1)-methyltransferase [Nocardia transvalensis]|uniref:23S rRNA (Guanine745-N1)-methyltransferase n=1 Tax=Nocardia transvalensis TaxID=37333 RepID=A0A7W9PB21_9NOCA|nr:methyltransferase domain-containing protein [Nocardia transvalensis]MBB5912463.1 23S rRNA (guanine745-N1)-methyltransferase [Nocardia transvalensis]